MISRGIDSMGNLLTKIRGVMRIANQTARLMVGIPDYENYVRHMREKHPDQTPMSYELFFRERQNARYGSGNGRCC